MYHFDNPKDETDDNVQHESIVRDKDTLPTEVIAARSADKSFSWSVTTMVILSLIAAIAFSILIFLAIRGLQNQPEQDPYVEFNARVEEREERLNEILSQDIEQIDRGFADTYSINDTDFGTQVSTTVGATTRTIIANGIPNHDTGNFSVSIKGQQYIFDLPRNPVKNAEPTFYQPPQLFGVAINGVPFNPLTDSYYNNNPNSGWQLVGVNNNFGYDNNNGDVDRDGAYIYKGVPTGLIDNSVQLIGFAGDGYLIYGPYGFSQIDSTESEIVELKSSYRLKSGNRPSGPGGNYDGTYEADYEYVEGSGDLDECNGRFAVTDEFPEGIYHYVLTEDYPFIPRCFWSDIGQDFKA